jgi:glycosyltransferase involved in cell wall biosynthesis
VTRVVFVMHQMGAHSNGGLVSIGELVSRAPLGRPKIITNVASEFSREWEEHADIAVWPMAEGHGGKRPRPLVRAWLRIANNVRMFGEVRRSGIRVVHVNDRHAFWNAGFGARMGGAKVVFSVRGTRPGASARKWRLYLRACDVFLVNSREMETHWQGKLAPLPDREREKFRHLYSIVDRERFFPGDAREPGRAVLVYPGRFDRNKGQLDFIRESLPEIVRKRADTVVHFLGDFDPDTDAYPAECREAARTLGLEEHVRFVGHSSSIADWYRAADLILVASRSEGLARCMIEGIACGVPVVSFAVCSAREILEEHACGIVVPEADYAALAGAVIALLEDDGARAAIAVRGPVVAEELFDPDRAAAAYAALVGELAGSSSQGRRAAGERVVAR